MLNPPWQDKLLYLRKWWRIGIFQEVPYPYPNLKQQAKKQLLCFFLGNLSISLKADPTTQSVTYENLQFKNLLFFAQ